MSELRGKVYFVGSGPGDPELITVKAKRIISEADVVVYADSLVPETIADFAAPNAEVHGSKNMALPEIMEVMLRAVAEGKTVARVQSGDPSVYGAILEQMRILEREEVEYEIIPGVSAAFAAAALLKTELTVPEVSQTIIMTRAEGRVAMPPREQLQDLAAHGCSLVIFLSITRMTRIVRELRSAGYPPETPIAVIYRVGWPEEMVIRGTLTDIAGKVRDAKINRQALVMVGEAVNPELRSPDYVAAKQPASSHLYSESYTHLFRNARSRDAGWESAAPVPASGDSAGS